MRWYLYPVSAIALVGFVVFVMSLLFIAKDSDESMEMNQSKYGVGS